MTSFAFRIRTHHVASPARINHPPLPPRVFRRFPFRSLRVQSVPSSPVHLPRFLRPSRTIFSVLPRSHFPPSPVRGGWEPEMPSYRYKWVPMPTAYNLLLYIPLYKQRVNRGPHPTYGEVEWVSPFRFFFPTGPAASAKDIRYARVPWKSICRSFRRAFVFPADSANCINFKFLI